MVTKFINYKKNLCVIRLYFWHNRMKNLLLKSKPKTPADIVRRARDHLKTLNQCCPDTPKTNKQQQKITELIGNLMLELKSILYGRTDREPVPQDCAELTQEFFKDNTLRLLIMSLSKLNPETRTDATHAVVNLLRQKVNSRMIACDYLEANLDLIDILVSGYDKNKEIEALHYGDMLRECIRHQSITKYLLESNPTMKLFFDYIQVPDFEIAADAAETFKQLLTRHKSTVAEFLSKNYDWFFADYESKLLESTNYVARRQAVKLLGEMLMHRSNSYVMTRFVSSKDNLRVLMNLLKEPSKSIKVDAFQVFKLFVANQNKPACIVNILVANSSKLLRLIIGDLQMDTEDEEFEADKALVVKEIAALEAIVSP